MIALLKRGLRLAKLRMVDPNRDYYKVELQKWTNLAMTALVNSDYDKTVQAAQCMYEVEQRHIRDYPKAEPLAVVVTLRIVRRESIWGPVVFKEQLRVTAKEFAYSDFKLIHQIVRDMLKLTSGLSLDITAKSV